MSITRSGGLNLHVYPTRMLHESRLERISGSLQASGLFSATHLVGIAGQGLPSDQALTPGRRIRRLGVERAPGESPLGKLTRLARWVVAVYRAYRGERVSSVSAHSVWMLPVCWALARRTGAVLVYLPHELETESARMRGLPQRLARRIEAALIERCAFVCVVNTSIADWYAERYGLQALSVRNIPLDAQVPTALRAELGLSPDEMLYVHTGNLVEGRSIPEILDAFSGADEHIVFLGDGALADDVRSAALGHTNIHLRPPVPTDHVVSHVREADVAVVLMEATCLSFELSSPNKLFEALKAGTPPLCTSFVEAKIALGDESDTWTIRSAKELSDAIRRIRPGDVADFRSRWPGLPTWEDEVAPLVAAFRGALE